MAKLYIDNINSSDSRAFASEGTPYVNPFKRMGAFPLDKTSVFDSLEDAEKYALNTGDKRALGGTSYPGQYISVVSETAAVKFTQAEIDAAVEGDAAYGKSTDDIKTEAVIEVTPYQIQGDGSLKNLLGAGNAASDILTDPWETLS